MIERLKHLRELWGWSQVWVAAMLQVSRSTLSRWERGESAPRPDNREKVEALVAALEKAGKTSGDVHPAPAVEIQRVEGDYVGGDIRVAGDLVKGDAITTTGGITYIIKDSVIVIVIPERSS